MSIGYEIRERAVSYRRKRRIIRQLRPTWWDYTKMGLQAFLAIMMIITGFIVSPAMGIAMIGTIVIMATFS